MISFYAEPGVPTTVTVRVYGDPNFNPNNLGLAVYAQAGDQPDCSPELDAGSGAIPGCEIDFTPDTAPPVVGDFPTNPPAGSPFSLLPGEDDLHIHLGPDQHKRRRPDGRH